MRFAESGPRRAALPGGGFKDDIHSTWKANHQTSLAFHEAEDFDRQTVLSRTMKRIKIAQSKKRFFFGSYAVQPKPPLLPLLLREFSLESFCMTLRQLHSECLKARTTTPMHLLALTTVLTNLNVQRLCRRCLATPPLPLCRKLSKNPFLLLKPSKSLSVFTTKPPWAMINFQNVLLRMVHPYSISYSPISTLTYTKAFAVNGTGNGR